MFYCKTRYIRVVYTLTADKNYYFIRKKKNKDLNRYVSNIAGKCHRSGLLPSHKIVCFYNVNFYSFYRTIVVLIIIMIYYDYTK